MIDFQDFRRYTFARVSALFKIHAFGIIIVENCGP